MSRETVAGAGLVSGEYLFMLSLVAADDAESYEVTNLAYYIVTRRMVLFRIRNLHCTLCRRPRLRCAGGRVSEVDFLQFFGGARARGCVQGDYQ